MTTEVVSPTVRQTFRRWRFWVGVGVAAVVIAIVTALIGGGGGGGEPLSPSNPAPAGAKALAEVLRHRGVEVLEPVGLDAAIADAEGATLLVHDPSGILGPAALRRIGTAEAARIVLLEPSPALLGALAPGVTASGSAATSAAADCAEPLVERAGTIAGDAVLYRTSGEAIGCWADGDSGHRVVFVDDGRIVVVGTTGAFSNEQIVLAGNAAFALGVLGAEDRLVWYRPTLDDADAGAAPDLGSLSPPWVVLLALLGVAVVAAAAVWRGRRMGPLVIEPLPAIVRADETMRGRARLAARSGARLRAADALRLGTLDRIAAVCGLPAAADVERIAVTAAALTGRPVGAVLELLRDRVPARDGELVRLAGELERLERDVRVAVIGGKSGE